MVGSYLLRLRTIYQITSSFLYSFFCFFFFYFVSTQPGFSDIFIDSLAQKFRVSCYSCGEPIDWMRNQSEACFPPTATPTEVVFTPPFFLLAQPLCWTSAGAAARMTGISYRSPAGAGRGETSR